MTYEELQKERIAFYNDSVGDLKGYDCPKCKNKGHILVLDKDGYEIMRDCECMKMRKLQRLAERSGLGDMLKEYTFDKYTHAEDWQNYIYNQAQKFIRDDTAHCFYIGGQIGSGKSHICTAMVREFIKCGKDVHFVVWNDIVTALKQNIMDDAEQYNSDLERLQNATVLYIDDLFKTNPSTADIDKAFQIINYRYNQSKSVKNKRYVTIISSEKTIFDLLDIDEAIASRIMEMCKKQYAVSVGKDKHKNMRFRQ